MYIYIYTKSIHNISDNDLNIIMNARKTLLFHSRRTLDEKE